MELKDRFINAIEFCLKADGRSGDLRALAEWALAPEDRSPAPGDGSLKIALVSGGATRIKSYVFESARLPEIRGASGLLDRINLEDTRGLWSDAEPNGLGCGDCVIYANGGEVLSFAPISKAAWVADEIERLYSRETMVAQSVAVWRAFELNQIRNGLLSDLDVDNSAVEKLLGFDPTSNRTFGSLVVPLALAKFKRREANGDGDRGPRQIAQLECVPFARRCSSCEHRAAVTNARVADDEDRPLCEPCARKRIFGQLTKLEDSAIGWWKNAEFEWQPLTDKKDAQSWGTRFERWLENQPELNQKYSVDSEGKPLREINSLRSVNDLGEIAQAARPQGFIGVVYADGNNVGQLIEHLRTPSDYSLFADAVFKATRDAVFDALAANLRPTLIQREGGHKSLVHPFEILSIGGDDLFLIVPAHMALPIACHIATDVEQRLLKADSMFEYRNNASTYNWKTVQRCSGQAPKTQCDVSLSAGVVIADAHTPVFYLEELTGQLLKSAKRRAKWLRREHNYYGGTVDFLTLKSVTTISGTIEQFRADSLTRETRQLYARPYTIAEIEKLIETVKLLKRTNFPRNQLHRLRESLSLGRATSSVDYHYFLSRDSGVRDARKVIEDLWTPVEGQELPHPWRARLEQEDRLETIWLDLVELYDFVPME
jgi:CRISPR-associated protein Cmr2